MYVYFLLIKSHLICSKWGSAEHAWTFQVQQFLQQKTKTLHVVLTDLIDFLQLQDYLHYVHCMVGTSH